MDWLFWMIKPTASQQWSAVKHQLIKFALVGVLTNLVGYSIYYFLTLFWDAPKLTMTALYLVGSLIGFYSNKNFTFRHDGPAGKAGLRYIAVQTMGYFLNFLLLVIFVDLLGYQHQIVQAVAIFVVAAFLFFLSRVFVFAPASIKNGVPRP
ncbi:GtrA family protein [Hydrogenophaga crassostreae]|nr:GtrA family protein [Hydrogenophaga crassostreae]